ncbi:unnamed protein product [Closterium sp. Naga37s-1]|nr:unnamed protein product [Closterium sp. Naga37s-1]
MSGAEETPVDVARTPAHRAGRANGAVMGGVRETADATVAQTEPTEALQASAGTTAGAGPPVVADTASSAKSPPRAAGAAAITGAARTGATGGTTTAAVRLAERTATEGAGFGAGGTGGFIAALPEADTGGDFPLAVDVEAACFGNGHDLPATTIARREETRSRTSGRAESGRRIGECVPGGCT